MDLVVRVMLQLAVTQRKELLILKKDSNPGLEITTFISLRSYISLSAHSKKELQL